MKNKKEHKRMKVRKLIWIIPLVLLVGFILGLYLTAKSINYGDVVQFCYERGYETPMMFERWNFNNTELFTIFCTNENGLYVVAETFDVYNEIHNKPIE